MAGLFNWLKGKQQPTDPRNFKDDKFKPGQVWHYNNRTGEENSTFIILKVERYDLEGIIIHIRVNGLNLKNRRRPDGISDNIGHMPFSKDAILKSVTTLSSSDNKLPDFMEGYGNWKEAFDSKKGGIFTITVGEAVVYMEEAINQ